MDEINPSKVLNFEVSLTRALGAVNIFPASDTSISRICREIGITNSTDPPITAKVSILMLDTPAVASKVPYTLQDMYGDEILVSKI